MGPVDPEVDVGGRPERIVRRRVQTGASRPTVRGRASATPAGDGARGRPGPRPGGWPRRGGPPARRARRSSRRASRRSSVHGRGIPGRPAIRARPRAPGTVREACSVRSRIRPPRWSGTATASGAGSRSRPGPGARSSCRTRRRPGGRPSAGRRRLVQRARTTRRSRRPPRGDRLAPRRGSPTTSSGASAANVPSSATSPKSAAVGDRLLGQEMHQLRRLADDPGDDRRGPPVIVLVATRLGTVHEPA